MTEFKIGDVVQLKSGGPAMTIDDIKNPNRYVCFWFDETDLSAIRYASFSAQSLKQLNIHV